MHLVFYKDQYRTLDKAMSKTDGLVILAVLLGVRKNAIVFGHRVFGRHLKQGSNRQKRTIHRSNKHP
jgi:hypothetical protein